MRTVQKCGIATALFVLSLAGGASGFKAEISKALPPCSNANLKQKQFILCKPRAGAWVGTITQQTPSGTQTLPFQFDVVRKNKNGTRVENFIFDNHWYCGSTLLGITEAPDLTATAEKESGFFLEDAEVIGVGNVRRVVELFGDFTSTTRAKGTVSGEWQGQFQGCALDRLTMPKGIWQARRSG